jgi:TM2 domain-containing membrane protein YozV
MIRFACPRCQKRYDCPDASAGRKFECECGQSMIIPAPPAVPALAISPGPSPTQVVEGRPQKAANERYCHECGEVIRAKAEICPHCGVRQHVVEERGDLRVRKFAGNKIAAGLCGILLGALGIHKFILGLSTPGVIMLLVSILTCGWGAIPMAIIGLVEGIIYLTKTDEDFYQLYCVQQKGWF